MNKNEMFNVHLKANTCQLNLLHQPTRKNDEPKTHCRRHDGQKLMLKVDGWNDKKQLGVNSTEMVTEREIRAMSAG